MKRDTISEIEIINRIRKHSAVRNPNVIMGIGDDCAVVKSGRSTYTAYTCDAQAENIHFRRRYISPEQLGRRAIIAALSDLCAIGATPQHCLVSLFLTKHDDVSYVDRINRGIQQISKSFNVSIIGGNVSYSKSLTIDIFAIGEVSPKEIITRGGARVGDAILVTGTLGDAIAGFICLNNKYISIPMRDKRYLEKKHLEPESRIKAARALVACGKVTAMIDLSDGLSTDLHHICEESKVGAKVLAENLPVSPSLRVFAKAINSMPTEVALRGGEDYELCFTAPKKFVPQIIKAVRKTSTPITVIGEITFQPSPLPVPAPRTRRRLPTYILVQ